MGFIENRSKTQQYCCPTVALSSANSIKFSWQTMLIVYCEKNSKLLIELNLNEFVVKNLEKKVMFPKCLVLVSK